MQLNIIKYALLFEKARTNFWVLPSLMVLSSIALALCVIYIDAFYIDTIKLSLPAIYGSDIDAIRSLLGTLAGAMITVTSIAFSITIVALTLASSQFGPRLLRNFMMDLGTQVVLGSFISNFLFCILIFCALSFEKPYAFQPGLSVIVAILMTCASVGVLIFFIHHVAKSIQADVVIDDVYRELQESIDNLFPSIKDKDRASLSSDDVDTGFKTHAHETKVLASCSGYVQTNDHEELILLATEHDAVIECKSGPGQFVVKDSVIAIVYSAQALDDKIHEQVFEHIELGAYRTPVQDPEFAIHQLVEIALRALSPGINDPYTAITCIDKLNSVLCGLTTGKFPPKQHFDENDSLRVVCKALRFDNIARAAFNQIRQEANSNVAVTIRLLESLHDLMIFARTDEQKHFVLSQTKMIDEQQSKQPLAKEDSQSICERVTAIYTAET